jgi:transposase
MHIVSNEVGIDVCKDWLDVSLEGARTFRASNTLAGIDQLEGRIPSGSVIHMESSGGYERLAHRELRSRGHLVRVHNPRKVRRLADVRGLSAKTDDLDARHLSTCGKVLPVRPDKSSQRESLCDISRAIQTLKADSSAYKKRIQTPELEPAVVGVYKELVKALELEIRELEKTFVQRVKGSSLKTKYAHALSVPGIGPVAARVLVSELHEELSGIGSRQVCSYAGLAPMDEASGKTIRASRLRKGNSHLKAAMYMPALTAIAKHQWAKDLYAGLRAKGRNHEQAIVPVMRRMLVRVVVVLKRGSPWQVEPPRG